MLLVFTFDAVFLHLTLAKRCTVKKRLTKKCFAYLPTLLLVGQRTCQTLILFPAEQRSFPGNDATHLKKVDSI